MPSKKDPKYNPFFSKYQTKSTHSSKSSYYSVWNEPTTRFSLAVPRIDPYCLKPVLWANRSNELLTHFENSLTHNHFIT